MNKLVVGVVGLLAFGMATKSWAMGGVEGSPHDFSLTNSAYYGSWNSRHGVCSPCHAAHQTDPAQQIPLWTHATSTATFTPYSAANSEGSKLQATVGNPSGISLACLSCHDGTVAINQMIGGTYTNGNAGSIYIAPSAQIGPDLHTTHPISFAYTPALAAADGQIENPMTYQIGSPKTELTDTTAPIPTSWPGTPPPAGATIDSWMLWQHNLECASCHDPHALAGSSATGGIMLRISGTDSDGRGSTICRTCHIK